MPRPMWFRLYDEVADDPKVQRLPDRIFKAWINFMCVANKNTVERGTLPELRDVAYTLHMTVSRTEALLTELVTAGLFEWDGGKCRAHNWNERQFQSDVSTPRVKRFRNARRNVSETPDETDQSRAEQSRDPVVPCGTPQQLFEIYNLHRGFLPEATKLTTERARRCKARLTSNNGAFIERFTQAVQRAAASPFCRGESENGWKLTFDFLIANDTNFIKVLEGKYDQDKPKAKGVGGW